MPKKKLKSTASRPGKVPSNETLDVISLPPTKMVISLPDNAGQLRNMDFRKYYGKGCDQVTYAAQRSLERMTLACIESDGKTLSANTIGGYFRIGLAFFLPFCAAMAAALGRDLRLEDIDRQWMDQFIVHLRESGGSPVSQRTRYKNTKSVLVEMGRSGWIGKEIFPLNPFPNSNRSMKGQSPLSEPERRSILKAIKADMQAIIKGSGPLNAEELVICLLAIAARTGINPTPATELLTDCLQPHPIKADRYLLVSFKRRGSNTHVQSLRHTAELESMVSALPDVARIINLVRERNAVQRQASKYQKFLFVYERRPPYNAGEMTRLKHSQINAYIGAFIARHRITNADGEGLAFNVMRLRKTFENRLFTLSGQDPFLTAKLGGHTLRISDNHYLEAPDGAEKDWRLMGEIRTEELLNLSKVAPLPTQNTPVARCRDTLNGDNAPKNGEHCQKFLACFRCRSFVVTNDDLYRVFSLYWALVHMRGKMGASAWKRVYGHIIRIIDQEITPQFDAEVVRLQRQRAQVDPHPFWRDPEWLEGVA